MRFEEPFRPLRSSASLMRTKIGVSASGAAEAAGRAAVPAAPDTPEGAPDVPEAPAEAAGALIA